MSATGPASGAQVIYTAVQTSPHQHTDSFRVLQRPDLAPSAPSVRSPFDDTRQIEQLNPGVVVINLRAGVAEPETRTRGGVVMS